MIFSHINNIYNIFSVVDLPAFVVATVASAVVAFATGPAAVASAPAAIEPVASPAVAAAGSCRGPSASSAGLIVAVRSSAPVLHRLLEVSRGGARHPKLVTDVDRWAANRIHNTVH